jgi:predicted O-methyltransferase YrrM
MTIIARLKESTKVQSQDVKYGAIIVVDNALVAKYVAEKYPFSQARRSRSNVSDKDALNAGREAGKSITLGHRSIAKGSQLLLA